MAVRFPQKDNPFYPLPADYAELSARGRKLARLNAVALRETPADMVWAWSFFRDYYLNHDQAHFYKNFKESPPFHAELISFYRRYRLNAIAAPRAGAKSTVIGTELPLMELLSPSTPGMSVLLLLSKDQFVESRFDKIMVQIAENPRLLEDFGRQRPTVGHGTWNRHQLRLRNHSSLTGLSVDGKKRGMRPDLLIIDDPEYDPESESSIERIRGDFQSMLTRQILGMLDPHAWLYWIGTLLSMRSYLYHIVKGNDPKFRSWNRRVYAAEYTDPETHEPKILWESKWSPEFLKERRLIMGEGAYRTEYCNDPRSDTDPILTTDAVLTGYHLVDNSLEMSEFPQMADDPFSSKVEIRWHDCHRDKDGALQTKDQKAEFGKHIAGLRRYITVDYAPTQTALSDSSVIMVLGMDARNTVWVLDLWGGKVRSHLLIQRIWKMATKWRTQLVGVEAVSLQDEIRQQVADFMALRSMAGDWTPRVVPIRYRPGVSKGDRIAGLEWRFNQGRIKLPDYLRTGYFHGLYQQIEDFTPDLSRLPHDDLVDALSMIHSLLPGGHRQMDVGPPAPKTLGERLLAGQFYLEEAPDVSVLSGLSPRELTPEMVDKLLGEGPDVATPRFLQEANASAPYISELP